MSGLYFHIPFCCSKCSYCDFFSVESSGHDLNAYTSLLLKQLDWSVSNGWSDPIDTVYFGGGTPSLLTPEMISNILNAVNQHMSQTQEAEISLEANPGTVSQRSLEGYRNAGINRLSLGLQTCNDKQLTDLGRLHNHREGLNAFNWARQAGFDNISLDLMFALPGQTATELDDDLQSFLELAPEHLSCYGLTAEPQTPLQQRIITGELSLPEEDFYADAFMQVHEQLTTAGYDHYEIANYARHGYACRHNLGYWQRRPYLGLGAGAHSFHSDKWGSRREVPADLTAYREVVCRGQDPTQHLEDFYRESALSETVYLGLRTRRGVADSELRQHFGCTLQEAFPEAVAACAPWLTLNNGHWSLTPAGWLLFDRLILPFL